MSDTGMVSHPHQVRMNPDLEIISNVATNTTAPTRMALS